MKNEYKLRYLPLFYDDFSDILRYIRKVLQNDKAAEDLVSEVESAILERLQCPEAYEQYRAKRQHPYPYYRIYVKHYVIYYVVIEETDEQKIMEVRRMLHERQEWKKYLR